MAMEKEATDSQADDAEIVSAYLGGLSGRARDVAALNLETSRKSGTVLSWQQLMKNVKETLEKNDTQADMNLLHQTKQAPGKLITDYKNGLLESGTRVMLSEGYNQDQIKDQLKIIFINNVRPEIHRIVKTHYPKMWEDAVTRRGRSSD